MFLSYFLLVKELDTFFPLSYVLKLYDIHTRLGIVVEEVCCLLQWGIQREDECIGVAMVIRFFGAISVVSST